jgi:hypothetical protein
MIGFSVNERLQVSGYPVRFMRLHQKQPCDGPAHETVTNGIESELCKSSASRFVFIPYMYSARYGRSLSCSEYFWTSNRVLLKRKCHLLLTTLDKMAGKQTTFSANGKTILQKILPWSKWLYVACRLFMLIDPKEPNQWTWQDCKSSERTQSHFVNSISYVRGTWRM